MEKKVNNHDLDTIKAAKEGFEKSFKEKIFYNKQTQDSSHLEKIIETLNFISDPTPNDDDIERFVDDYMRMKKDGHIKYYTKEEYEALAREAGLSLVSSFETEITFPRLKETAIGFDEIIKKHNKDIINRYNVRVTEDNKYIYITQKVLNLLFKKENKHGEIK